MLFRTMAYCSCGFLHRSRYRLGTPCHYRWKGTHMGHLHHLRHSHQSSKQLLSGTFSSIISHYMGRKLTKKLPSLLHSCLQSPHSDKEYSYLVESVFIMAHQGFPFLLVNALVWVQLWYIFPAYQNGISQEMPSPVSSVPGCSVGVK